MSLTDVINALALPTDVRVDQRVPKKLFLEQGAPTAADKRLVQDGIEEVQWAAALKPANIGVAAFKDDTRDYLEIAVLTATLRQAAKAPRLTELIHRAIPYPLLLVTEHAGAISLSAAHKRSSLGEAGKTVIEDAIITAPLRATADPQDTTFLDSLRLSDQPAAHLLSIYQGWVDRLHALAAARLTGAYQLTQTASQAAARQAALADHDRIVREIAVQRAKAAKVSDINTCETDLEA